MRKNPCGSRSGTQINDRIMIRSPRLWSGAKCLWSGTKINGFRMTEVGHMKIFFNQSFEIFQVAKICSKKKSHFYTEIWKKIVVFPNRSSVDSHIIYLCSLLWSPWPLLCAIITFSTTRVWTGGIVSKCRDNIHYTTVTYEFIQVLGYYICE